MPFAKASMPSIALTQLKSVVEEKFEKSIDVNIFYFNMDMAVFLGESVYEFICNSAVTNNSGFGDWYFRGVAFPDLPDNTEQYFKRYGPMFGKQSLSLYYETLASKRNQLESFLHQLIDKHNLLDAQIIGFTSMFMQNAPSFALARLLKQRNPDITIVMGGANCEFPMGREIINNIQHVDYVFSGPALKSFPEFLKRYYEGESDQCSQVDGVFSSKNIHRLHRVVHGADNSDALDIIGKERDINEVVKLDYDSFMLDFATHFPKSSEEKLELLVETSRGCWWGAKAHCTFCGLNGATMSYRAMNKANALGMFDSLFSRYGDRVHYFSSVDNIVPKEYFSDVFPSMNVPDNVSLFYEVKADLSENDMRILANAHVLTIQPGIESMATSTLKLMRKGTTAFNNIKFLENALRFGIKPAWNLLIGFPGEKEEVFERYLEDLPKLFHLPPPVGVGTVRFDRFSPYFTQAGQYKLDLKPLDFYKLIFPFSEESMCDFAYYFMDMNYDADYIRAYSKYVSQLNQLVDEWKSRWQKGEDHVPSLCLFERDGSTYVYDSRSDFELEYMLNDMELAILDDLRAKKSMAGLVTSLKIFGEAELRPAVERLVENNLLFEENGTYMNLILLFKSKKSDSKFDKVYF